MTHEIATAQLIDRTSAEMNVNIICTDLSLLTFQS